MMTIEFPEGTFEVARNYNIENPCDGCFWNIPCPHIDDCDDFDQDMAGDRFSTIFKEIAEADASDTVAEMGAGASAKTPPECTGAVKMQEKQGEK